MNVTDIRKICVVGAGQMGSQIAMQAALCGYPVTLHDIDAGQLTKALDSNRGHLERRVQKGKMTRPELEAAMARIRTEIHLESAAADADFVIEAVIERLDPKREVFSKLDRICPKHTILATNSSYLGNSQIATATQRPDKVVNMHWFYPPLVMRLVEVVRGEKTSDETVQVTMELVRRLDRVPVLVRKEVPGFIVNRILRAIQNEAYWMLENGVANHADIDLAVKLGLNHPMGPFELADLSGLDVGYNARVEAKLPVPRALEVRVRRGDLGRKTGRGFYDYSREPPEPTSD